MPSGWLTTMVSGKTVMMRLAEISDASIDADLQNIKDDLKLQNRGIATVAQLQYAVDQAVTWCTAHDPDHDVPALPGPPPSPAFTLDKNSHKAHVKSAWDAVSSGDPTTYRWGDCLEELEHGGDSGDGSVATSEFATPIAVNLNVDLDADVDEYQREHRMARIIKLIQQLGSGRPVGPPGDEK